MSTTIRNVSLVLGFTITLAASGVFLFSGKSSSSAASNDVAKRVVSAPLTRNLDTEVKLVTSVDLGIPRPGRALR